MPQRDGVIGARRGEPGVVAGLDQPGEGLILRDLRGVRVRDLSLEHLRPRSGDRCARRCGRGRELGLGAGDLCVEPAEIALQSGDLRIELCHGRDLCAREQHAALLDEGIGDRVRGIRRAPRIVVLERDVHDRGVAELRHLGPILECSEIGAAEPVHRGPQDDFRGGHLRIGPREILPEDDILERERAVGRWRDVELRRRAIDRGDRSADPECGRRRDDRAKHDERKGAPCALDHAAAVRPIGDLGRLFHGRSI